MMAVPVFSRDNRIRLMADSFFILLIGVYSNSLKMRCFISGHSSLIKLK